MKKEMILLILSDVLILSSFGLISPIFAIFLTDNIVDGSLVAAGLASAVFFITKSVTQLPLSRIIDKNHHKVVLLLIGTLLVAIVPFLYLWSTHMKGIYFAQIIYGLGTALAYPTWFSLFTKFIDKKHKGFEYSVWSTGVGIGSAITAYLGAELASVDGFNFVFFIVGGFSICGFILLFFINHWHWKKLKKLAMIRI